MSNFDFNKLRQQVKQTNNLLKEQFKGTEANIQAVNDRGPEWRQANEARYQDPSYGKRVGKSISETYKTPEGRKKQQAKSRPHTQEACEKIRQANIGLKKSDEVKAKLSQAQKGNTKHCKPIYTPLGVFPSLKAATEAYKPIKGSNAGRHIQKWLKTDPDNFYYIKK